MQQSNENSSLERFTNKELNKKRNFIYGYEKPSFETINHKSAADLSAKVEQGVSDEHQPR